LRAILHVGMVAAIGLNTLQSSAQTSRKASPDRALYAMAERGQRVGAGEERERLVVYTASGAPVAVAHVWLVEPDGSRRAGIRGCEDWGWVDNTRLFCRGTINPSTEIYLVFDAKTGAELHEFAGSHFVWSPNRRYVAGFGNVPHFTDLKDKSDSIELQGKPLYPKPGDIEQHWFRSLPVWAADSQAFAVVDHRRKRNTFVLVVAAVSGGILEIPLASKAASEEWPVPLDFELRWEGRRIVVRHHGTQQVVEVR
jgi:hypothetical protein